MRSSPLAVISRGLSGSTRFPSSESPLRETRSAASYGLSARALPSELQAVRPAPSAVTSRVQLTTVRVRGVWFIRSRYEALTPLAR